MAEKHRRVAIYTSFAAENRAEDARRARASTQERLAEFACLLARVKGSSWTSIPLERTATVERVAWHDPVR
jgi:hypothetical protein